MACLPLNLVPQNPESILNCASNFGTGPLKASPTSRININQLPFFALINYLCFATIVEDCSKGTNTIVEDVPKVPIPLLQNRQPAPRLWPSSR
jgi:hypothetical protein